MRRVSMDRRLIAGSAAILLIALVTLVALVQAPRRASAQVVCSGSNVVAGVLARCPGTRTIRSAVVTDDTTAGQVQCNTGEQATGGGFNVPGISAFVRTSVPIDRSGFQTAGATPTGWGVNLVEPQSQWVVYVVCETP